MAGAYQIITSTLTWASSKLASVIPRAASSSSSKKHPSSAAQELQQLESTMRRILAKLLDAEESDIIDKSEQLRLSELREVAYGIEDIVDDYDYEVLRVKVEARRRAMAAAPEDDEHDKVFDWNSYCPAVTISDKMMDRMRKVRENFERITDDWERIHLRENDGRRRNANIWKPEETTSFSEEETFGREDEKDEIIEWLLEEGDEPHAASVLAIIGMGGMGKSTLAKLVYNFVSKHFYLKAWVYVSEAFDVVNVFRNIVLSFYELRDNNLSSNEQVNVKNMSLDLLYQRLKKQVEGKRYVIVLHDVWNLEDLRQLLRSPLTGVGTGKIIVTTRNEQVATIMQITTTIFLEELPLTDCMPLFERIAFQGRDSTLLSNLSEIGESIVKKCKGLPLAVKILASILSLEGDESKWKEVLESELWEDEKKNNEILPILKLSYDHMPVELRPCFMYLSLFPKNSDLKKKTVVEQWMSQGFLQAKGKKAEEDVGNSYFNELLQRSILQYSASYYKDFVMHDLIHDLAQFFAKDEYLLVTTDKLGQISQKIPGNIRHIAIYLKRNSEEICLKSVFESTQLRTLVLSNVANCSIAASLHNLTCLRTLNLYDYPDEKQATKKDAFCNLKHLRFLQVGYCVSTLEPICRLYHLQSFNSWGADLELCKGVGDLINLRHLSGRECSVMHHEVGWLTNLRTLSNFKIGAESWECKLRDLKDLTNLRGRIRISGLGNIRCSDLTLLDDYLKKPLQRIEKLGLSWRSSGQIEMDVEDERSASCVLSCFRHHPNLIKLTIYGYPCATFPTWFGDASFSKLQVLHLKGGNCASLPTLGQLPALRRLYIEEMKKVEIVGRELLTCCSGPAISSVTSGCCFPSLENLEFRFMDQWKEWNGVEDCDFPQLSSISIFLCPELRTFPSLHSLTELEFEEYCDLEVLLSNCCLPLLRTLCILDFSYHSLYFPGCQSLRSVKELIIDKYIGDESGPKYIEGLGNLISLERLEIRDCCRTRISRHEQLPPSLLVTKNVQIHNSPKVETWYKKHVLGGGGGSVDTQQTDPSTEEEEELSEEENNEMHSDTEKEELNEEMPVASSEGREKSCGERGDVDGGPSEEGPTKRRKI